jgi:hypothetical protein
MKNITVAVSDNAYKTARLWAANSGTSVSAFVQIAIENVLPRMIYDPNDSRVIKELRLRISNKDKAAQSAPIAGNAGASRPAELTPESLSKLHRICEAMSRIEQNQQVAATPITVSPAETVKTPTESAKNHADSA